MGRDLLEASFFFLCSRYQILAMRRNALGPQTFPLVCLQGTQKACICADGGAAKVNR